MAFLTILCMTYFSVVEWRRELMRPMSPPADSAGEVALPSDPSPAPLPDASGSSPSPPSADRAALKVEIAETLSENDYVAVMIRAPREFPGEAVYLRVGDERRLVALEDGVAWVPLYSGPEGPTRITVDAVLPFDTTAFTAFDVPILDATVPLNGSGRVELDFSSGDKEGQPDVLVRQWPLVTWNAAGGTLDVVVNGEVGGSTSLTRGVRPNEEHNFVWRRENGRTVCAMRKKLPYDVRRTYTCNLATGRVQ
jgi:hypothetical protein